MVMPVNLDANHLGTRIGNKIFEPQRQNNGLVFLPTLMNKLKEGGFTDVDSAESIIALSIDTFPIPKQSNNIIEVPYNNQRIKFAGAMIFDDMDLTLKDNVDIDTAKLLNQWRLLVSNPSNGAVGLAHQYKINGGIIMLYAPNGSYTRYYQIDGVWLSRLDCGDIDMSADDYLRITATLTIDRVIPLLALDNNGTNMPKYGAGHDVVSGSSIKLGPL